MATYQLRPMALGEMLDGALAIYRRYFGTFVSIAIVCEGAPAVLNTYVMLGGGLLQHPMLWLLSFVLSGLGGLVAAAATVWVISEAYLGREPVLADALTFALGKIVPLFVAGMAKYLVISLGLLFFLIPGVVIACGYAVVAQSVVLEDPRSGIDALGRSWDLTRGYKDKAFVLGLVMFTLILLPFIVALALTVVLPYWEVVLSIAGQLLQLIIYPVVSCAFTLLYYDLRVRKEGFDVHHLSRQLGLEVETAEA
jgi:hypothetical protein